MENRQPQAREPPAIPNWAARQVLLAISHRPVIQSSRLHAPSHRPSIRRPGSYSARGRSKSVPCPRSWETA